jgi:hypothetical protein
MKEYSQGDRTRSQVQGEPSIPGIDGASGDVTDADARPRCTAGSASDKNTG